MLSTDDLIVQESQLHYPTVISLFGAYIELPSHKAALRGGAAQGGGRNGRRGDGRRARHRGSRRHRRDGGHAHAREGRVPPAGGRGDGRLVGIVARGDILRAIVADLATGVTSACGRRGPRSTSEAIAHNVGVLLELARSGAAVRGGQGRRVRARRGGGRPSRARRRGDLARRGALSRRVASCGRPASTPRSCCCPSPAPPRWTAVVTEHLRSDGVHGRGDRGLAEAARRGRGAGARPPEGRTPGCTGWARRLDGVIPLAELLRDSPGLGLEAVWTHCAVADEPDNPFTDEQVARLREVLADLEHATASTRRCPPGQLGGGHRPSRGPLRPRAGRHRGLRRRTGPGPRRASRPAPGHAARVRGVPRPAGSAGGRRVLRPPVARTPGDNDRHGPARLRRRRAPSLVRRRRRGPPRGTAPATGRRGDHGPAHGRLRRRLGLPPGTKSCSSGARVTSR